MRIPPLASRRLLVGSAVALLALAVSAVVLAVLVYGLANTSWGRRVLESATARWTGGNVVVVGLGGHFPDDLRAARIELRDDQGTWGAADDVHVQWSPARLLHHAIALDLVEAASVQITRLPRPRAAARETSTGAMARIDLGRIELPRVAIGAALAGTPAVVAIRGGMGIDWPRQANADLRMLRTDAPGTYSVQGWINTGTMQADVAVEEPLHGLLAGLAGLGEVGAVSAQLHLQGARDAPALQAQLAAGALRASATGSIDGNAQTVNLDVTGSAPAMAPRADLQWQSVALQAHVHGPFRNPDAMGQLRIEGLSAAGAQVRSVRADVQGAGGALDVHALADQVRLPGRAPDLLQGAPLDLRAHVRLDDPARPATFTLSHPLASIQGEARAATGVQANFIVTVPQLAPFAALAGADLQGRTVLTVVVTEQNRTAHVDVTGAVDVTGGSALVHGLIGGAGKLDVALAVHARDIDILRARFDTANVQASVTGTRAAGKTDLHWHAAIARLAALSPDLDGDVEIDGRLEDYAEAGRTSGGDGVQLAADVRGRLGTRGFANRPVQATLRLRGLPGAPVGSVEAHGTLEDAPVALAATLARAPDGNIQVRIDRADWKSAQLQGEIVLRAGESLPRGHVRLQLARLADVAVGSERGLQGSAIASVELAPAPSGRGRATFRPTSVISHGRAATPTTCTQLERSTIRPGTRTLLGS